MALEVEIKLQLNTTATLPLTAATQHVIDFFHQLWPKPGVVAVMGDALMTQCLARKPPELLQNAYYETATQWFRQQDWGLRTRFANGQFEQTIKTSGQQLGGAHVRPEFNLPAESVWPQLSQFVAHCPELHWPIGTDVTQLQQQLQQVFRTDFTRQRWHIHCQRQQDEAEFELVLDDGAVIADAGREPIAEIELELYRGSASLMFAFAKQLLAALPLQLGFQSKAERGYRLAKQQALTWQPPANDRLPADAPAPRAAVSRAVRALLQNLQLQHYALNQCALNQCALNHHEAATVLHTPSPASNMTNNLTERQVQSLPMDADAQLQRWHQQLCHVLAADPALAALAQPERMPALDVSYQQWLLTISACSVESS
jgi:inorganic triphosphatase YgiF